MNIKSAQQEDIKNQILDAAEARFRTYGYGKTTMAEIATDIGMSAANLYRFFENKLDIGAALAQRCFTERHKVLEEVVNDPQLGGAERLEKFVLTVLRHTHEQFSAEPKINELVEKIITHRQDLVADKMDRDQKLVVSILQQGQQSGEFDIANIEFTAEAIRSATVKFCMPIFMCMYPLQEFERMAKQVVQLLLKGIEAKT